VVVEDSKGFVVEEPLPSFSLVVIWGRRSIASFSAVVFSASSIDRSL
jgi:hypothetical protein